MINVKTEKLTLDDVTYTIGNVDNKNKYSVFINGITKMKLINDIENSKRVISYIKKEIKYFLYSQLKKYNIKSKYFLDFNFSEKRLKLNDKCKVHFELIIFPTEKCDKDKLYQLITSLNEIIYNNNNIKNYLY